MKTLLVAPPRIVYPGFWQELESVNLALPLGLLYIAAVMEREGHEVEVLDCFTADFPYTQEGGAFFVGMPWEGIKQEIERRQPDVVGVTGCATNQIEATIRVARIVKSVNPRILTVAGGPPVTAVPVDFLNEAPSVDIAVAGEGELAMLDILRYHTGDLKLEDISGIAYRRDGAVVKNQPRPTIKELDSLPFPAYHLMDMELYLDPRRYKYRSPRYYRWRTKSTPREMTMVTSRGCPFDCVFCAVQLQTGRLWRAHSAEYVLSHIQQVVSQYQVDHIHFLDDNMSLEKGRFEAILDGLIQRGLKITWDPTNGVRADRLDLNLLRKMKQTGCFNICVGVESGVQDTLDNIVHKRLRLEDVIKVAQICKQVGIRVGAFYIIGFPGETVENMERTIDFAIDLKKRYDVGINMFPAIPLKGTKLYQQCVEKGYLVKELSSQDFVGATNPWAEGLIRTPDFEPDVVTRLAARAMSVQARLTLLNYLKRPQRLMRMLRYSHRDSLFRGLRSLIGR